MFLTQVKIALISESAKKEGVLSWIESHPVSVGIVTTVIASFLWLRRFIRQKRAEAFFGFYARLSLQLSYLQTWLSEKGLLEVEDYAKGNIYTYLYDDTTRARVCPSFFEINHVDMEHLKNLTIGLQNILMSSENNNVYPYYSDKDCWIESQNILFAFCEYIKNINLFGITNISEYDTDKNDKTCYKHVIKCEELINAIEYISDSIEKERY